ncbi:MAG: c-type cytochrome domain-containing protein, partial [Planctomycetaceae bacterium]
MRNSRMGDGLRQTGWKTALLVVVAVAAVRADDEVDYTQDIKPILSRRCATCHGAVKQNNRLRLDTAELAKQGGDAGPAVVPGDLEGSLLLDA